MSVTKFWQALAMVCVMLVMIAAPSLAGSSANVADSAQVEQRACGPSYVVPDSVVSSECQPITLTSTLTSDCGPPRVDLVFVVPLFAYRMAWIKDVALGVVDVLAATTDTETQVGLVLYSSAGRGRDIALTSDLATVRSPLARLDEDVSGPALLPRSAVDDALDMLRVSRDNDPVAAQVLVLFTAYKIYDAERVRRLYHDVADKLSSEPILVALGCEGESILVHCDLVRDMAPPDAIYAEAPDRRQIPDSIADHLAELTLSNKPEAAGLRVTVSDELRYSQDARPAPHRVTNDADGSTLLWRWDPLQLPITLTMSVAPRAAGEWSIESRAVVTTTGGAISETRTTTLVRQLVECELGTPSPTAEPTQQPTLAPTPSPSPTPRALYLPIALRELPCSRQRPLAIMVVLDTSSSMLEGSPAKLVRAKEAIGVFLDHLQTVDRVGLVSFDAGADLVAELTSDLGAVKAALAGVSTGTTTRLDLGIEVAADELNSSRRPATHRSVLVVLTDGRPNPVGATEVLAAAGRAKDAGMLLFTIGLGDDVDGGLLAAVASSPDWYVPSPSADDLQAAYVGLLEKIPCDPDVYWGGR